MGGEKDVKEGAAEGVKENKETKEDEANLGDINR